MVEITTSEPIMVSMRLLLPLLESDEGISRASGGRAVEVSAFCTDTV